MNAERELAEGVREGRASAFDALYAAYSKRLYYFALSVLKSDQEAEELVQNTFFKVWEQRKSIDSTLSIRSFLFAIAYRTMIDQFRKKLKEKKYREKVMADATANFNPEESIVFADLLDRITQIVEELPPRKKQIYHLSRIDHRSYQEIAQELGITVKTVENGINYSMNFIKKRLGESSLGILLFAALFT